MCLSPSFACLDTPSLLFAETEGGTPVVPHYQYECHTAYACPASGHCRGYLRIYDSPEPGQAFRQLTGYITFLPRVPAVPSLHMGSGTQL